MFSGHSADGAAPVAGGDSRIWHLLATTQPEGTTQSVCSACSHVFLGTTLLLPSNTILANCSAL